MSNSPTVLFLRSATMILALISLLAIAIFWNGLPSGKGGPASFSVSWKHFFQQDEEKPSRESKSKNVARSVRSEPEDDFDDENSFDDSTEENGIQNFTLDPPVETDFNTRIDSSPDTKGADPVLTPSPVAGESDITETDLPQEYRDLKKTLETEYGVTEIRLEPWGSEGNLYRFSCSRNDPPGSGVKKLLQAIQPTPLSAIQKVAEEIVPSGNSLSNPSGL